MDIVLDKKKWWSVIQIAWLVPFLVAQHHCRVSPSNLGIEPLVVFFLIPGGEDQALRRLEDFMAMETWDEHPDRGNLRGPPTHATSSGNMAIIRCCRVVKGLCWWIIPYRSSYFLGGGWYCRGTLEVRSECWIPLVLDKGWNNRMIVAIHKLSRIEARQGYMGVAPSFFQVVHYSYAHRSKDLSSPIF